MHNNSKVNKESLNNNLHCLYLYILKLKLTGGWAGYYDCNRLDNNAVVGKHPKFENVYLATGFTGRGLMQAPGIGRALTELITTGAYQSIDISNMAVERVLGKEARPEPYVL